MAFLQVREQYLTLFDDIDGMNTFNERIGVKMEIVDDQSED